VSNHATFLAEVGRRGEALAFSDEAVALYRELAALNRDAYLPDLARYLWAAAWVRVTLNTDLDHGLALIEEAVRLYLALVEHEPEVFVGTGRAALATQADILHALGRYDEASAIRDFLEPTQEQD
jgi:hypothetical protein